MTILRKGVKGQEVRMLQETLKKAGYRVGIDGNFGAMTDLAVRAFQRRKGMLPDGIVGPKTIRALGMNGHASMGTSSPDYFNDLINLIGGFIARIASLARTQPLPHVPSRPASGQHISQNGLQFIFTHESLAGVSNHLHWPGGASGVTLGAGYDMKTRTAPSIANDMTAIGLDAATAKKISGGASLVSGEAKKFAVDNKMLVNLTSQQETRLLTNTVPQYEAIVKSKITVDLLQHEYDALVSFAYNPGGRFQTVANHINQGQVAEAMKSIKLAVTSKGVVMKGLVNRRNDEVALYLYGNYGHLRR